MQKKVSWVKNNNYDTSLWRMKEKHASSKKVKTTRNCRSCNKTRHRKITFWKFFSVSVSNTLTGPIKQTIKSLFLILVWGLFPSMKVSWFGVVPPFREILLLRLTWYFVMFYSYFVLFWTVVSYKRAFKSQDRYCARPA